MVHASQIPYKGFLRGEGEHQEAETSCRQKLNEFIDNLHRQQQSGRGGAKVLYTSRVREGDVHHVLRAEVKNCAAELLVLGTHGRFLVCGGQVCCVDRTKLKIGRRSKFQHIDERCYRRTEQAGRALPILT